MEWPEYRSAGQNRATLHTRIDSGAEDEQDNGRNQVGLALGAGWLGGWPTSGSCPSRRRANIPIDRASPEPAHGAGIIGAAYRAGLTIEDLRGIAARTGWWQVSRPAFRPEALSPSNTWKPGWRTTSGQFDVRDLAIPLRGGLPVT